MIAKESREGWFQNRNTTGYCFGTTPALRATPPDSGGELRHSSAIMLQQTEEEDGPAEGRGQRVLTSG